MAAPDAIPSVYDYEDYRKYLREFFEHKKSANPRFSYTIWARRLKTSSSYLKNVLTYRRHIKFDKAMLFGKTLGLSDSEISYFMILMLKCQTRDPKTRRYFEEVLYTLHARRTAFKDTRFFADKPGSDLSLRDPVLHLLLSLIRLKGFQNDPKWIRPRLADQSITDDQIDAGFKALVREGVIEPDGKGYRVLNESISSPDPFNPSSFKVYRTGLVQTDRALENVADYRSCSFFLANCTVSEEDSKKIIEAFNRCRDEIMEIESKTKDPTKVVFISNNLLNLVK